MANTRNDVVISEILIRLGEEQSRRIDPTHRSPDLELERAGAGNGELTHGRDAARREIVVSDDLLGEQNLARHQHISRVLRLSVLSGIHLPLLADYARAMKSEVGQSPPSTGSYPASRRRFVKSSPVVRASSPSSERITKLAPYFPSLKNG